MSKPFWLDFTNLLIKLILLLFVTRQAKLCSFTQDIQTTLKTWPSFRTPLVKMYKIKCIYHQFITNLIWECSGRLKYQSKGNWITCVCTVYISSSYLGVIRWQLISYLIMPCHGLTMTRVILNQTRVHGKSCIIWLKKIWLSIHTWWIHGMLIIPHIIFGSIKRG